VASALVCRYGKGFALVLGAFFHHQVIIIVHVIIEMGFALEAGQRYG
jgi:hypothetical protein